MKRCNHLTGCRYFSFLLFVASIFFFQNAHAVPRILSPYETYQNPHTKSAAVFVDKGDYEKAIESLKKAYVDYEKENNDKGMLLCLERMGWLYREIGEYSNALQALRKAHPVGVRLHGDAAEIDASLGYVYLYLGDSEKVEEFCQRTLQTLKGFIFPTQWGGPPSEDEINTMQRKSKAIIYARIVLGMMHYSNRQYEQALDNLNKANNVIKNIEMVSNDQRMSNYFEADLDVVEGIGYIQTLKGAVYGEIDKLKKSRKFFKAGEKAFKTCKREYGVLLNQGLRYKVELTASDGGVKKVKLSKFDGFLDRVGKFGAQGILWQSAFVMGQALVNEKRNKEAKSYLSRAIEALELTRAQLADDRTKKMFASSAQDVYGEMIQLSYDMKQFEVGFDYLERAKARAFLDMLEGRRVKAKKEVDPLLVQKERDLSKQLEVFTRRLKAAKKKDRKVAYKAQRKLLSEYKETLERIKEQSLEFAATTTVGIMPVERIVSRLENDTALVSYFIGKEKTIAWIINAQKVSAVSLNVGLEKLARLVADYRSTLYSQLAAAAPSVFKRQSSRGLKLATGKGKSELDFDSLCEEVSNLLIYPLSQKLSGAKKLIIIPSKALQYLPFSSLYIAPKRFLIEDFTLSMLPNASSLFYLSKDISPGMNSIFLMGNPKREEPGMALAFAEEEVKTVSKFFSKPTLLVGEAATESAFKEGQVLDNDIVHFAAHAMYDDKFPLKSAMLLAKDGKNDGNLETLEIFSITLNPGLVVLSACETGIGKLEGGDEVQSLNRAFIYAGAGSVVSSLWSVADQSTYQLMTYFYEGLVNKTPAESLREAQLRLMKSHPLPFHWAPFYLIGGI